MEIDSSTQARPPPNTLLGFVVPGGPVRTDFVPDASGTKFTLTLDAAGDLPSPLSSVSDVVCFLLPNAPLPPTHGLLVYWQITVQRPQLNSNSPNESIPQQAALKEETGFELFGSLTRNKPSGVFRTNWSQNELLLKWEQEQSVSSPFFFQVVLGVSMEPMEQVQNLSVDRWGVENRLFVAQKIASDLFRYMQSFDSGNGGRNGFMTVPSNIFDRWIQRFEARFKKDPNFFMKSEE